MLVVSYNPGYQNILKSLKPSTRQRFLALAFDFPPPERGSRDRRPSRAASVLTAVGRWSNSPGRLRALKGQDLEEGVSTRLIVYCASLIAAGMKPDLAVETALIEPLSDDADVRRGLAEVVRAVLG